MLYKETAVMQAIAYLLSLNGNKMNKLKLMKELYIADREFIKDFGFSISGDEYFSLKHGPILSFTLNILDELEEGSVGDEGDSPWKEIFSFQQEKYYKDIILNKEIDFNYLSEAEKDCLKKVADKYKDYTAWQLVDETHDFPEWKSQDTGRDKIKLIDIFKAVGKTDKEIEDFLTNQKEIESFEDAHN